MSVNEYLERARRHEAQESWSEALYLYERAISQLNDEGNQDPSLYSRVGDLQFRLNRPKAAATAYEQATDLYTRAMDLDGAFAVCQKILRHLPELDDVYLRIARIRAMQGYTEWARQHYLTYAQLKGAKGERDVAIRSLEELVAVVPDDVDTRLFVSERLTAEGRRVDALEHLKEGYRRAVQAKNQKAIPRLRDKILALDPGVVMSDLAPMDGSDGQLAFESSEIVGRNASKQRKSGSLARLLGALGLGRSSAVPSPAPAVPEEDEPASSVWDRPATESRAESTAYFEAAAAEPAEAEASEQPADVWEAAPADTAGSEPIDPWAAVEAKTAEDVRAASGSSEIVDAWDAAEAPEPATEWASNEGEEPATGRPSDEESEAATAWASDEADEPAPVSSAEEIGAYAGASSGEPQADHAPEAVHAEDAAQPSDPEEDELAAEEAAVLELLAAEPFEVAHHERFVRYAARRGERELLIEGLFHMAIALRAAGLEWRAKSTLARIMSMDPTNVRVLEVLGYGKPEAASDPFLRGVEIDPGALQAVRASGAAPATPAHAAGEPASFLEPLHPTGVVAGAPREPEETSEGYVDLAAMILEDVPEPSTRWQVEFSEPAPNEEADFAKILAQFKDQVSKNLERSDARAHYDLGSAYKGMGLVHEAIAMFQKALRADAEFLPAIEMLGRCFLDNGEADAGIRVLSRGLDVKVPVEDDLLGVYYYLGNGYEMLGNADLARDCYLKVFARDINFLDVTDRLRGLRPVETSAAAAV